MATGTNLSLQVFPASWQGEQRQTPSRKYVNLEREAGKVGNIFLQFQILLIFLLSDYLHFNKEIISLTTQMYDQICFHVKRM